MLSLKTFYTRGFAMNANRTASSLALVFLTVVGLSTVCKSEDDTTAGASWNPSQSDQWVATDQLGRALPTFDEVGATRPGKYVACFYFLWNGRHGDAGPYDISKILKEHPEAKDDPDAPYWGEMYAPHHWGESIFGYYVGEDESVLRKHAQMLGDAGVDVICFDVTNQLTYPESYRPLFKVFSEMQKEGNRVPKVAFLCPFWAPDKVVRELWRDVYSQDYYKDVWFYWKGKPLILADPAFLNQNSRLNSAGREPFEIHNGETLSQTFSVKSSFTEISFNSPTWTEQNSSVNIRLLDKKGKVIREERDVKISDNVIYQLKLSSPCSPGVYTAELSKGHGGRVGWWSIPTQGEDYAASAGKLHAIEGMTWLEAKQNDKKIARVFMMSIGSEDEERDKILDFFTFRPSQPDYFIGPVKPNQWSWLEAYPQHPFYNDRGELEEMGVGVAQNAVDGKLGVLSNPRSYGRSYHNGAEPAPEDCNYEGMNFQEQWERALKTDPEIIFITGWNEWIAGRFDKNAPFHGATPVSFVDQYNEEFSRDCEPMKGGHADAYYYQMISNIRRFKGVSKPTEARPQKIDVDGKFNDWRQVVPIFHDTISDPVDRDCRGWGKDMRYVNHTGRNDLVESRVSFDGKNLYFYLKTKERIIGEPGVENWLNLMIDADDNPQTGAKGADFIVRASEDGKTLKLFKTFAQKDAEGIDSDFTPIAVAFKVNGNEFELSTPLDSLGISGRPTLRFKWTDGIDVFKDWSVFTTDGDSAPNDRYYYRYVAP